MARTTPASPRAYQSGCGPLGGGYIPAHGFHSFARAAGVSGDGARLCARGLAAAGAGLGRAPGVSGRGIAAGGGAGFCRDLCRRGIRRQRARPGRCRDHFRGAGRRLRLDRRLYVDPQHGVVDDRPLWRSRSARPVSAKADPNGPSRQLLPDRARQRLGRGGVGDPRPPRRRRVCAERRQGVHLGRRGQRHLCRDGANRGRGPARHILPRRRKRHTRPVLWQKGKKARLEQRSRRRW